MSSALRPSHEQQRLRLLQELRLQDTSREEVFDRLVRAAADLFHAPIAGLAFVGEHQLWLKSSCGVPKLELRRDTSISPHAILGRSVLVIPDALQDARSKESPLVKGSPGIRFFACAPVFADENTAVGTLCVCDTVTRAWNEEDSAALSNLAALTSDVLRSRRRDLAGQATTTVKQHFIDRAERDLREPARIIRELAEAPPADAAAGCRDAIAAGRTAIEMVEELLDHARIETGSLSARAAPVHPEEMLEALSREWGVRAAEKDLELHVDWEGDLPRTLETDPRLIHSILTRLVSNAVKFTPSGIVSVTGCISAKPEGGWALRFQVADTGVGMPAAKVKSLFQATALAADAAAGDDEGLGLGCYITRTLVDQLGGSIMADSSPGAGTTIEIYVPCDPVVWYQTRSEPVNDSAAA